MLRLLQDDTFRVAQRRGCSAPDEGMGRASLLCVTCLLVAVMHGVEAKTPKAAAIIPGNSEPSDNANLHNAFFDKFDANRDGVISRDEVAHVLPSMVASDDAEHERSGSA